MDSSDSDDHSPSFLKKSIARKLVANPLPFASAQSSSGAAVNCCAKPANVTLSAANLTPSKNGSFMRELPLGTSGTTLRGASQPVYRSIPSGIGATNIPSSRSLSAKPAGLGLMAGVAVGAGLLSAGSLYAKPKNMSACVSLAHAQPVIPGIARGADIISDIYKYKISQSIGIQQKSEQVKLFKKQEQHTPEEDGVPTATEVLVHGPPQPRPFNVLPPALPHFPYFLDQNSHMYVRGEPALILQKIDTHLKNGSHGYTVDVTEFDPSKARWKLKAYVRNDVVCFRGVVWSINGVGMSGQGMLEPEAPDQDQDQSQSQQCFALEFQKRHGCSWAFAEIYRSVKHALIKDGLAITTAREPMTLPTNKKSTSSSTPPTSPGLGLTSKTGFTFGQDEDGSGGQGQGRRRRRRSDGWPRALPFPFPSSPNGGTGYGSGPGAGSLGLSSLGLLSASDSCLVSAASIPSANLNSSSANAATEAPGLGPAEQNQPFVTAQVVKTSASDSCLAQPPSLLAAAMHVPLRPAPLQKPVSLPSDINSNTGSDAASGPNELGGNLGGIVDAVQPLLNMISSEYYEVKQQGLVRFACLVERLSPVSKAKLVGIEKLMVQLVALLHGHHTDANDANEVPANVHYGGQLDPEMELHRGAATVLAHLSEPELAPLAGVGMKGRESLQAYRTTLLTIAKSAINPLLALADRSLPTVDLELRRQAARTLFNLFKEEKVRQLVQEKNAVQTIREKMASVNKSTNDAKLFHFAKSILLQFSEK